MHTVSVTSGRSTASTREKRLLLVLVPVSLAAAAASVTGTSTSRRRFSRVLAVLRPDVTETVCMSDRVLPYSCDDDHDHYHRACERVAVESRTLPYKAEDK